MAVCKGLSATNAKRAAYYIKGDRRCKRETAVKKALCVILYGLGKASFSMFGKILNHAPPIIYRWINEAMDKTLEPSNSGDIREIEFDEWRKNKVILSLWGMVKMRCWGSSMAFSSKKKSKILDHRRSGSSQKANCCLGYRGPRCCNVQATL
jgi:hypothetical protein